MYGMLAEGGGEGSAARSPASAEACLDGNLCRCTGYFALLKVARALASTGKGEATPFPEELRAPRPKSAGSLSWIRPQTLEELEAACLTWWGRIESNVAVRLVCGSTSQGVWRSLEAAPLPTASAYAPLVSNDAVLVNIDISGVPEIADLRVDSCHGLHLGSAVSLTRLLQALTECSGRRGFEYCSSFAGLLRRVAGTHVRNAASWAGGVVMARDYCFPSDVATALLAAGAELDVLLPAGRARLSVEEFLRLKPQSPALIVRAILKARPPVPGQVLRHYRAYKSSARHVNSHSLLNAAFSCTLVRSEGELRFATTESGAGELRIVFGGLGESQRAMRAVRTESKLRGRALTSPWTLRLALRELFFEVVPKVTARGITCTVQHPQGEADLAHRRRMVSSFFFEFFCDLLSHAAPSCLPSELLSAFSPLERPVSACSESFDAPDAKLAPVGEPQPKLAALLQASGAATFTDDVEQAALVGALVSNVGPDAPASGFVASLDATEALKQRGVVAFFSAADVPGKNDVGGSTCLIPTVDCVFAPVPGPVDYVGQPLGLVVADTREHAEAAAKLVRVVYTGAKETAPILTIEEAVKAGAFYELGDDVSTIEVAAENIDEIIEAAPLSVHGKVSSGSMLHFYMEKQTSLAVPDEDRIVMHSATQNPAGLRNAVAAVLGVKIKQVTCKVRRCGGGFGGKISRSVPVAAAAAVAARALGRAVKIQNDIYTDQSSVGGRAGFTGTFKCAVDRATGKIGALALHGFFAFGHVSDAALDTATEFANALDGAYHIPVYRARTTACRLNISPRTSVRAPGHMQASFLIESVMERVASETGLDPEAVRAANMYTLRTAVNPLGQAMCSSFSLPAVWGRLLEKAAYSARLESVRAFNASNRWRKRGLCAVPVKYGTAWFGSGALVSVEAADGSVTVTHSGVELGQGIHTRVAQVAAFTLQAPLDSVRVADTSTEVVANCGITGGSMTTGSSCEAVRLACLKLRQRMASIREANPGADWAGLAAAAAAAGIDLAATGRFTDPGTVSKGHVQGIDGAWRDKKAIFSYFNWGAGCTEIELDVLTGEVVVVRSDVVYDCGKSLNPALDVGQVEGAFVMGLGFYLHEENPLLKSGAPANNGTWEYKPPSYWDTPVTFNVELLSHSPFHKGVLTSKAVGEPPKVLAYSAHGAVRSAIRASREERGLSSSFDLGVPATVVRITEACAVSADELKF